MLDAKPIGTVPMNTTLPELRRFIVRRIRLVEGTDDEIAIEELTVHAHTVDTTEDVLSFCVYQIIEDQLVGQVRRAFNGWLEFEDVGSLDATRIIH